LWYAFGVLIDNSKLQRTCSPSCIEREMAKIEFKKQNRNNSATEFCGFFVFKPICVHLCESVAKLLHKTELFF